MAIVTTKLCRKQAFSTTGATKHGAFRRLSRSAREWALEWALDTTVPSPPLPSVTGVLSCHLICSNFFFICSNFISYAATIFLLKQLYLIWNFTVAQKNYCSNVTCTTQVCCAHMHYNFTNHHKNKILKSDCLSTLRCQSRTV